jgi:hypothetical protein
MARRDIRRVPLSLALRTAPRFWSDWPEAAVAPPRQRVVLDWRAPAAEIDEGRASGQAWSSRRSSTLPVTGVPGPGVAPAAPARAITQMLEPAVAERLVEDVIRRVDRRMRIERERRGL